MSAHHLSTSFPSLRVGVAVLQGHDGLPLQSTCFPATAYVSMGDTGRIIEHTSAQFPGLPLVVMACSIGAAHFTHWAGTHPEKAKQCRVVGAVLVCHGYASRPAAHAVDSSGAAPFILGAYRDILRRNVPNLEIFADDFPDFEPSKLWAAQTLREWDEALLPVYGIQRYEDVLDAVDTTPEMLQALPMPVVFVGAANDARRCTSRVASAVDVGFFGAGARFRIDSLESREPHGLVAGAFLADVARMGLRDLDLMTELVSILADMPKRPAEQGPKKSMFCVACEVSDAQELLLELLKAKTIDRTEADQEELLAEIGGLFMKHEGCHWASGQPFLDLLAKSFEARAKIWQHMRWYN
ncbi:Exostosin domain-containing protein [Durusdinium trenchii]|uniref:Exostosin domain-containing protein n=1 Tax=Durusdinium trenchii TaxID=1381693 RepID=A0ABP0HV51_9DINO